MESPVSTVNKNNLLSKSPLDTWKIDIVGPFTTTDKPKLYILVGVCILTKYAFFAELSSLTSLGIKDGLQHLFSRFRVPRKIISDQQSGMMTLAKESKMKMKTRDMDEIYKAFIENIEIEFVATNSGHQSISEAERLIRSIRRNLGNFNVTKLDFTGLHLNQILEKILSKINRTPYFRRKEHQNVNNSLMLKLISPFDMIFNMKNISFQEDSNDNHFLSQEEIQDIAYNCIINYQTSDSTGKPFSRKKIKINDIVLFKTNRSLHPTFDYYQVGLVSNTYDDYDHISRKIDIKYFLSVEGNVREMSAKRMIREVIFVEDYDPDQEDKVDKKNEESQEEEEEDKNEQLRIEDIQSIVESDEEAQVENTQEDELAEEDDTTKPMMTRRGRIIKMPARFLLITMIGILF